MAVDLKRGIRRVQPTRVWPVTIVFALVALGTAGCVVVVPVSVPSRGLSSVSSSVDTTDTRAGALSEGPQLTNVASLPVDASGEGTIQGAPTGEATTYETWGTFVLVLDPAPPGLPPRTTVSVGFDHSTKVYRGGQALSDALTAMNESGGPADSDPSAAGTVTVRFHIKDGRPFADRLDLSDQSPPGIEP